MLKTDPPLGTSAPFKMHLFGQPHFASSYFEAIIPESLREPFVEAVRIRSMRLSIDDDEEETALETVIRKCNELGLGNKNENNFLLGGGEHIAGGKIKMRVSTILIELTHDL